MAADVAMTAPPATKTAHAAMHHQQMHPQMPQWTQPQPQTYQLTPQAHKSPVNAAPATVTAATVVTVRPVAIARHRTLEMPPLLRNTLPLCRKQQLQKLLSPPREVQHPLRWQQQ